MAPSGMRGEAVISFNLTATSEAHMVTVSISQMGKPRFSQGESLAQGHTTKRGL